jgi:hypothetical protein
MACAIGQRFTWLGNRSANWLTLGTWKKPPSLSVGSLHRAFRQSPEQPFLILLEPVCDALAAYLSVILRRWSPSSFPSCSAVHGSRRQRLNLSSIAGELAELEIRISRVRWVTHTPLAASTRNHPGRLHDVFFPCGLLNSELTCGATGLALIHSTDV